MKAFCIADAVFAAQIGDRNAGLVLFQNPDDLLFRKATALHALVLVMGQSELQPGLSPRGNVTGLVGSGSRISCSIRADAHRCSDRSRTHFEDHVERRLGRTAEAPEARFSRDLT